MNAQVFQFDNFALSSKGLLARAILPNTSNSPVLRDHIQSITHEIYNITDGGAPVVGSLVVDDVMFNDPQPWSVDKKGYYFAWTFPGMLNALAGKSYRIVLTFTFKPTVLGGVAFILAWQSNTVSPSA